MLLFDNVTKIRCLIVSVAATLEMSFHAISSFERQNHKNTGKEMPVCQSIGIPTWSGNTEFGKIVTSFVFREGTFSLK